MKTFKKSLIVLMALVMMFAICIPALAANDGSITITNATAEKEYTIYKVFDLTYNADGDIAYFYTKTGTTDAVYTALTATGTPFVLEESNVENVYNVSLASGADADDVTAWLGDMLEDGKLSAIKTIKATDDTVTFDGLAYGYYYITSTLGTIVTVDKAAPTVNVIDKNVEAGGDFSKKIQITYEEGGETKTKLVDVSNANVGDDVEYVISFSGNNTNEGNNVTNYFIYDIMNEALTFNASSLTITVGSKTLVKDTDYTISYNKTVGDKTYHFVINLPWVKDDGSLDPLYDDKATVTVSYNATVNEKIKAGGEMENIATYDLKDVAPDEEDDDERKPASDTDIPTPTKPETKTETYTAGIEVLKVDASSNKLTGAKFKLSGLSSPVVLSQEEFFVVDNTNGTYYRLASGTEYTTDAPITTEYYKLAPADYDRTQGGYVLKSTSPDVYEAATADQRADTTIPLYIKMEVNTNLYYKNDTEGVTYTTKYKKVIETYVKDNAGTYYMLKDGTYTSAAPVLADRYDEYTATDRTGHTFYILDAGEYKLASADDIANTDKKLYTLTLKNDNLYDSTTQKYKKIEKITKETVEGLTTNVDVEGWVDGNGRLFFDGLGEGTYTLTELVAPDGYNLLKEPIEIVITFDTDAKEFKATVDGTATDLTDSVLSLDVVNTKGTELPTTGGAGTIAIVGIGSLLFIAAAVVLITKKRMYNEG